MRPLARFTRSVDRTLESSVRPRAFSHICTTCRQSTAPFSTSSTRAAEEPRKLNKTIDTIRKKIWGTDKSPGRDNSYDPESPMRQIEEMEAKPVRPGRNDATPGSERIDGAKNNGYKPARTWDGLEWVGSPEWVWKQRPIPDFKGLVTTNPKRQAEDLEAALRKSLIEVVAQKAAFRDIVIAAKKEGAGKWMDKIDLNLDRRQRLVLNAGKQSQKQGAVGDKKPVWFDASIADPHLKYMVAKRFMKDTGIRISDFTLQRCNDPGLLLASIEQQLKVAKKEKLAEVLKQNAILDGLSNVKIVDRRVTPIDKEKEVGRWKLIEDELLARGLPVTGRSAVQ